MPAGRPRRGLFYEFGLHLRFHTGSVGSGPNAYLIDASRNAGVTTTHDPSRQQCRELSPALTIGRLRSITTNDHTKPPHSGGAFISRQVSGGGTSDTDERLRCLLSDQRSSLRSATKRSSLMRRASSRLSTATPSFGLPMIGTVTSLSKSCTSPSGKLAKLGTRRPC